MWKCDNVCANQTLEVAVVSSNIHTYSVALVVYYMKNCYGYHHI